jgi:hypothetical protein
VNQRLRRLDGDPARRSLFETHVVTLDPAPPAPRRRPPLNLGAAGEAGQAAVVAAGGRPGGGARPGRGRRPGLRAGGAGSPSPRTRG